MDCERSDATPERSEDEEPITCADVAAKVARLFKVGDVVHLKSGGPDLTLIGVGCTHVEVAWFNGSKLKIEELPYQCIADGPCMRPVF